MIHMAHHSHDRRTRLLGALMLGQGFLQLFFQYIGTDQLARVAQLFHHQDRGILVDHLIDGGHHTQLHQLLDHFTGLDGHLLRQDANGNHVGQLYFVHFSLGGHFKSVLGVLGVSSLDFLAAAATPGQARFSASRSDRDRLCPAVSAPGGRIATELAALLAAALHQLELP